MKPRIKKLVVNRETVRILQEDEAARVVGGKRDWEPRVPWDKCATQGKFDIDLSVPECVLPGEAALRGFQQLGGLGTTGLPVQMA